MPPDKRGRQKFTKPVAGEAAIPCPKCRGAEFDPA